MKRHLLVTASILMVMACQDANTPASTAPIASPDGELSSIDISSHVSQRLAVVDLNGNLLSGNKVASVSKLGTGQYEVTFTSNVSQCAYLSTTTNIYSQAIQSYTAGGHLSANGVFVETKNQGGGLTDGTFNLVVTCGTTGLPFAVVGYTENLVRGSAGVSMTALGSGRYNITFPTSVAQCAFIGTVADPGNALVLAPSGVYVGSGPNANTVYVETKNPGGGLQDGVPFHLTVFCSTAQNTRFAVVKPAGAVARASSGTTVTHPAAGQYTIAINRSVVGCANLGTRGSATTSVPFNPATVEVVPGATTSSYGVQVRQLLGFGGALTNQAFHTASVCP